MADGMSFCTTVQGGAPKIFNTLPSEYTEGQLLDKPTSPAPIVNLTPAQELAATAADWSNQVTARVTELIPALQNMNPPNGNFNVFNETIEANTGQFVDNMNILTNRIRGEYCFYFARYYWAVTKFLRALRGDAPNTNAAQNKSNAERLLDIVKRLNSRLTYLVLFTNEVADRNSSNAQGYTNAVKSLNTEMENNKVLLEKQRKIFDKEVVGVETHRRMVEYTQEKNRANNNLLAMYGVLNAVALAMIVYVSRT